MQDRQPPRSANEAANDHGAATAAADFRDTSHPEVGPQPSSRPGLDRLVSQQHAYSQTHWRDGLAEALDRERTLQSAAAMELAAIEERQRDLNQQHGDWAAQSQAHELAAEAIERVLGELDAQDKERRKMSAAEDDEPVGRRWRG